MAAFTTFDRARLEQHLNLFELGELVSFSPVEAGIENSNYLVTLSDGGGESEYILTILESLSFDEVSFFNALLGHLANQGLPVPVPRQTLDGMSCTIFCGKPSILCPKLTGSNPSIVDGPGSHETGRALARIHLASDSFPLSPEKIRRNPYSPGWAKSTLRQAKSRLSAEDYALLSDYVACYEVASRLDLPRGIIHGDLFRDNTLFAHGHLTGIIDFYHACHDVLSLDLAITLNDWCSDKTGGIDTHLATEMIAGYESVRSLTTLEHSMLQDLQKAASMCFVLSRLQSGENGQYLKDPEEILRIARALAATG